LKSSALTLSYITHFHLFCEKDEDDELSYIKIEIKE